MDSTKTITCEFLQTVFFADTYRDSILAHLTCDSQLFPIMGAPDELPKLITAPTPILVIFGAKIPQAVVDKFIELKFQKIYICGDVELSEATIVTHVPYSQVQQYVNFARGYSPSILIEYALCEDPNYETVLNREDAAHFKIGVNATDEYVGQLVQRITASFQGSNMLDMITNRGAIMKSIRRQVATARLAHHMVKYTINIDGVDQYVAAAHCSEFVEDMRELFVKEYVNLRILYRFSPGEEYGYEMNIIGNEGCDIAALLKCNVYQKKSPSNIITWMPTRDALNVLTFLRPDAKMTPGDASIDASTVSTNTAADTHTGINTTAADIEKATAQLMETIAKGPQITE